MASDLASPDPERDFEKPAAGGRGPIVVIAALAFLAILGVWLLIVGGLLIDAPDPPPPAPPEARSRPDDEDERRRLALEAWTRYIEAPDVDEKLREVLDPQRIGPLMRDYYERRSRPFLTMAKASRGQIVSGPAREAVLIAVEGYQGHPYAAALEWRDGRYRVDWEALTAYGSMDWYELLERRPTTAQRMRVFLRPLKERWQHPALPEGAVSYMMEHRDAPDPAVLVALPPEAATISLRPGETGRSPVRVEIAWSDQLQAFQLLAPPRPGWSD